MTEAERLVDHLDKQHSIIASSVYPLQVLRLHHERQHLQRAWPHEHKEDDEPATGT